MKRPAIFILMTCFLVTACLESGGSNNNEDFIPNVEATCFPAQVPSTECNGSGDTVFIGLTDENNTSCWDLMANLGGQPIRLQFNASGTATSTQTGGYLSATVNNWVSPEGANIDLLTRKNYKACAFIDLNANAQFDSATEPLGEGQVTPGTTPARVDDWRVNFQFLSLPPRFEGESQ